MVDPCVGCSRICSTKLSLFCQSTFQIETLLRFETLLSFAYQTLTKTSSLHRVKSLLQRRPLPTQSAAREGPTDSDSSDSEQESFLNHEAGIKKKKRRSTSKRSATDESDSEPSRPPLAPSIHHNREAQRAKQHPGTMSSKSSSSRKSQRSKGSRNDNQDAQQELEEARMEIARLKKRQKVDKSSSSGAAKSGTSSAMEREVAKTTKTQLWKICKFIKNDSKLNKATKCVMEKMVLAELEGLEGTELVEAQEEWKGQHSKQVRTALNQQRNYVQQVRYLVVNLSLLRTTSQLTPQSASSCPFSGTSRVHGEGGICKEEGEGLPKQGADDAPDPTQQDGQ